VVTEEQEMEWRTVTLPRDLLRRIERLRRQLGNPKGDDLIIQLLKIGLKELNINEFT